MKTSTVLHKQIRVAKFNKNLASALVKHDLLLDDPNQRKQHRVSEKSYQNGYTFRGQKIHSEEERQEALHYIETLFQNDNHHFDSRKFSKTKSKFKKWIDAENTTPEEKELYTKLLKITDKEMSLEISLNALNQCGKVKRYNDKKKALESLTELHNQSLNLNLDSGAGSQLHTRLISTLYKIPMHNEVELTGQEQEELINSYYSNNFQNYEVILSVIHNDEAVPHVHLTIDGKNSETGQCDFVQNQYDYIKSKVNLVNFPNKYSECNQEQVKVVGEQLQQDFYQFSNVFLNNKNKGFIFEKKQYESEELKQLDRQKIKLDSSKRIADREYNTANYFAEQKKQIIAENNTLKGLVKTFQKHLVTFIQNLLKRDTTKLTEDIDNIKKTVEETDYINSDIAETMKESADDTALKVGNFKIFKK